jgi:ribose/xylose/arabinose/galactoside ABC-type transport system permease subunit
MNKNILGILGLFIFIFGFTALNGDDGEFFNKKFLSGYNLQNLVKWSSLYAIMGIGVAFVIITGGIDLSIGSVIGLVASLMALMVRSEWNPVVAVIVLLALSLGIGLVHGLLVTKMKLQPFVVTLCGLLFYRGISRWATDNQSMGYGDTATLNSLFSGKVLLVDLLTGGAFLVLGSVLFFVTYIIIRWRLLISVFKENTGRGKASALLRILITFFYFKNLKELKTVFFIHYAGVLMIFLWLISVFGFLGESRFALTSPFFFLVVIGILAAIFLNRTIWGRYLLALGNNEDGARYSGIETDRLKITAYVICSFLAGLSGLLFAYELDSVQPAQTGEFYELYAIAAAVLGGCSLRGGQGTILGVIIAAAVIRLLRNSINLLGISTHLEYAIIGMVILCGVSTDEIIKRIMAKRRAAK